MIHIAKSLAAKLLLLLLASIVLSAFLIGSMRLLTPAVSYFRGELEQWAGQWMQRPVHIGGLSARWRGLGPEIVLKSVELNAADASQAGLRLAEVRLSLAILESLRNLEIKTRQVTFSGANLLVRRHQNGTFTIGGLDNMGGGGGDSSGLFAIPSRIRLEQSVIAFEDQLSGAEPVFFRNVNAQLRNAGGRHQLAAELPFPGGGELALKADIRGDAARAGGWSADVFVQGRNLALTELLQSRIAPGYSILSGRLNAELWSHWRDGLFTRTQGRGQLQRLLLEREADADSPARQLSIDRLGGSFLWTAAADGWQLDVRNIQFARNGSVWPESGFSVSSRFDDHGRIRMLAGADFARAGDLAAIARVLLSQHPQIVLALQETAVQGELHDLRFEFEQQENANLWSFQGRFDSLTTQPWRNMPGVRDLDAAFWLNGDGGTLLLNGHSTVLHFPGLFRDPLNLKRLQGQISWTRQQGGGWRLESPDILAVTNDIHTNTRLMLDIPGHDGTPAFMDLQTDFSDGLAINAHRYYPVGIMPPAVVAWLDRGIVDGKVTSGSALVRGPLRDFPFHKTQNGIFEVFFHTENMTIDYSPGWPRLTDVAAEVRFLQNGFDVLIERGMIFDSRLNPTQGRIADFGYAPFELKGSVQGALLNNLRLLRESPLAGQFAGFAESIGAAGDAVTSLDLTIPIRADQRFSLDGKIDFTGSSLQLQEWQLPLTDIRGNLNFTEQKIQARGIRAKALGSAIVVNVETLGEPQKATRIEARTRISGQQLARYFSAMDFGPVSGDSVWTLRLDIPHRSEAKGDAPSLLFSSNLKGVAIELPAPLGKTAGETRTFALRMKLPQNGSRSIYLDYGELMDLALAFATDAKGSQKVTRGALRFGGEPVRIPQQEGFEISGRLKMLDLAAWGELLRAHGGSGGLPLNRLELELERLSAGDFGLDNVSIDFRRDKDTLQGGLSSRQAEGELQIPTDILQQPVLVRLQRLSLNYDPGKLDKSHRSSALASDPTTLPAIDLEVEKTEINGKDFGNLQLVSRRIPTGQELQIFSLKGKRLQLSASGSWTRAEAGEQVSRLQLSLTTGSLGKLLDDLGYQKYIDQAPAVCDSQLHWPGSPLGFSPDILNGRISVQLGKGQFLNVDPGIGRVFGLLNIAALQRRLSLDFSDLLNKGLAFDSVGGNFELDAGDAYTTDFQIKGPSAQVDISGRTGLANEDFDQLVTVTPHLSAALPVAGLLAGGPVGGAAMLLAQGLIGKEFDKASKRQYEVKGAWTDPVLTPLGAGKTAPDLPQQDQKVADGADAGTPQSDESTLSSKASWLLEALKKQFTPNRRIDQDAAEDSVFEGDP